MKRILILITLLSPPVFGAGWTDRAEYDLVLGIRGEAVPQKQIALLDEWKAKYPATELRQIRRELYFAAYQALGDSEAMLQVSGEMLKEEPASAVGTYWVLVLTPSAKKQSPDLWDEAERAATRLLSAKKNPGDELLARKALGWARWQRGDFPGAEQELTAAAKLDPKNVELAGWLGLVLGMEKRPEKQSPALWQLARAAPNRQMNTLLESMYTSYHGDTDGLEALKTDAAANAFPPEGFHIETAAAIAARRAEEELTRTNPELAAWLKIRKQLEAPEADANFTALSAAPLPKLKGVVVRCTPAKRPTEIVLSMNTPGAEEVTLRLDGAMENAPEAGAVLEFEGIAQSFTKSPFGVVMMTTRDKVTPAVAQ